MNTPKSPELLAHPIKQRINDARTIAEVDSAMHDAYIIWLQYREAFDIMYNTLNHDAKEAKSRLRLPVNDEVTDEQPTDTTLSI